MGQGLRVLQALPFWMLGGAADPIQLMKLYDKIFPYPTFCVKIVEIWIICCACEGNGHFTNNNVTGKGNLYEGLLL